ncbi:MAG TPA: HRDC domain-containing protein [Solirubrobacteraceae bacterium]|nr:HRDC domain-containing protein [Solirubrobacteraceae bacterium]
MSGGAPSPSGEPQAAAGAEELIERARAAGRLALDTEFMGEGRYRTLLCLIQLAAPERSDGGESIALVDPLREDVELEPLAVALADPDVRIVVHAGRQDIALLRRELHTEVANIFDTQVAAGFAGLGAQASYDSLLTDVLGLRVAKTASFTRWDARPLSAEQLAYAREDVVHLLELAAELERRLAELGRLDWALEECRPLSLVSDERDPQTIFERLPRVGGLNASARAVARELVEWRERTAERHNRPVQSVLSDAALVEVARRRPASGEDLAKIRGVGASAQGRRARELLDAVARARRRPAEPPPQGVRHPPPKPEDLPLVALAESLVRTRAREAGLAYELLASRADLQAVVAAARTGESAPDVRTLRGWRAELVGNELLELLDGRLQLSVDRDGAPGRLRVERRE